MFWKKNQNNECLQEKKMTQCVMNCFPCNYRLSGDSLWKQFNEIKTISYIYIYICIYVFWLTDLVLRGIPICLTSEVSKENFGLPPPEASGLSSLGWTWFLCQNFFTVCIQACLKCCLEEKSVRGDIAS